MLSADDLRVLQLLAGGGAIFMLLALWRGALLYNRARRVAVRKAEELQRLAMHVQQVVAKSRRQAPERALTSDFALLADSSCPDIYEPHTAMLG